MSDSKYPQPPVDPNLTLSTGKAPDRPMNSFERSIAAALPSDPRHNASAKKGIEVMFPDSPDGVTGDAAIQYDDKVNQATLAILGDADDLANSEAMQWARDNAPRGGVGGIQSSNPATLSVGPTNPAQPQASIHDEAARQAADLFGENSDEMVLSFADEVAAPTPPPIPTQPRKAPPASAQEKKEDPWPKDLPKVVRDAPDLFKVLSFYHLHEDQVMQMILDQEKPLTAEGKKMIWEKELEMSGLTIQDIDKAIKQFLSTGQVTKTVSMYDGALTFKLSSRRPDQERIIDLKLTELLQNTQGTVLPSLEEKTRYLWKVSGSLVDFAGFGKSYSGETPEGEELRVAMETRAAFVDSLPSVAFQMLTTAVSKLDNLCYYAAQKLAAENFS